MCSSLFLVLFTFLDLEYKQSVVRGRWMKEGKQIDKNLCGELEGASGMIHRLISVITHDERIVGKSFRAVRTGLVQTPDACSETVFVVHNEHDCSPTPILVK